MCTKKTKVIDRHCNSPSLAELKLRKWLNIIKGNQLDFKSDKSNNLAVLKGTNISELNLKNDLSPLKIEMFPTKKRSESMKKFRSHNIYQIFMRV